MHNYIVSFKNQVLVMLTWQDCPFAEQVFFKFLEVSAIAVI